jgi:hypothetical protein
MILATFLMRITTASRNKKRGGKMKNRLMGLTGFLASLSLGIFLFACSGGSNNDDSCNVNDDCKDGKVCNPDTKKCEPPSCTPDCDTRTCGPAPNTCNGENACGICDGDKACTAQGTCCAKECGTRQCGLTPASCDDPAATCGTCSGNQFCGDDGACQTPQTHDKAGDACKCETAGDCSIPCADESGAYACMITNVATGEGFCTYDCSTAGSTECSADFQNGCCATVGQSGNFCMAQAFCPGTRGYLETCGRNVGNCLPDDFLCVAAPDPDPNHYCLYTCDCPNPTQNTCPGSTCTDGGTCHPVTNTSTTHKGACIPPATKQLNEFCTTLLLCDEGLTCLMFQASTPGKGVCGTNCDCQAGSGCTEPMECGFRSGNGEVCACSNACPNQQASECPNGGTGWVCAPFGTDPNIDYYCIPE